jgi:hypothetical protein
LSKRLLSLETNIARSADGGKSSAPRRIRAVLPLSTINASPQNTFPASETAFETTSSTELTAHLLVGDPGIAAQADAKLIAVAAGIKIRRFMWRSRLVKEGNYLSCTQ